MPRRAILVVEDDLDTREMLREVLGIEGYRVRVAEDGVQALRQLAGPERFAAVVLDLVLPELDGRAVIAAMAGDAALRQVPVLAISASLPSGPLQVAAFFHKPFSLDDLLAGLARAHRGPDTRGLAR
ncbi:MAG: response regulator transcription factor [Deltaproteobacteria bacterium]|nr:response regulator transcription factor [Deltaproteobacteria bacterium]